MFGDEDCLYLNIWSPPNARELPVMFWLHGGGNTIGHGGSYSGTRLATAHNLVVVHHQLPAWRVRLVQPPRPAIRRPGE